MSIRLWRDISVAMEAGSGWALEYYDSVVGNDGERLDTLVELHNIDLNEKFTEARLKKDLDLSPIHVVAYKGYTGKKWVLFTRVKLVFLRVYFWC